MEKIRAYVRVDEFNNIHYSRNFKIVDRIPDVGDYFNHYEVANVIPVSIDVENSGSCFYYDYFEIQLAEDGEYCFSEYICKIQTVTVYSVRDRECGDVIDVFDTYEDAAGAVDTYEDADKYEIIKSIEEVII